MTEREWVDCESPWPMLVHLAVPMGERKLRLFWCACCRRLWGSRVPGETAAALEVCERYADGLADDAELADAEATFRRADLALRQARLPASNRRQPLATGTALLAAASRSRLGLRRRLSEPEVLGVQPPYSDKGGGLAPPPGFWRPGWIIEQARCQSEVLRELFAPFHPGGVDPACLTRNGGVVRRIAGAIYARRRFEDLPLLADALEKVGCTDESSLSHCRVGGDHYRGCWVLDLLLEKS